MYIPTYQVHNIIELFKNRLCQNRRQLGVEKVKSKSRNYTTPEGKRQVIVNQVIENIISRISIATTVKSQFSDNQKPAKKIKKNGEENKDDSHYELNINIIDANNNKKKRIFPADMNGFPINSTKEENND